MMVTKSMQIASLSLFPVANLHDPHRRSYKVNVTNEWLNKAEEVTNGGSYITQYGIGKIASGLIAPSAESIGAVPIVHGWQHDRFRFVLEVVTMATDNKQETSYYIGYTDYGNDAIAANGMQVHIAPELTFHITSVHRVHYQPHTGVQLKESAQMLYNDPGKYDIMQRNIGLLRMRPTEVFNSQNQLSLMQNSGLIEGNHFDFSGSTLTGGETSSRRNNLAGLYLYDIFDAYNHAAANAYHTGGDDLTLSREARDALPGELSTSYDPFINELYGYNPLVNMNGGFTFRSLMQIFPEVDNVTTVYDNTKTATTIWNTGNTQHWGGSDMNTVIAASIAQSVPTIMLENLVMDMRVDISNMTINGQFQYQIATSHALSNHVNVVRQTELTVNRIITELLVPMSQNGEITISLTIDSSVYGETMINISYNGSEYVPYIMPTFADNGTTPILTNDYNHYQETVHSLFNVAKQIFNPTRHGVVVDRHGNYF